MRPTLVILAGGKGTRLGELTQDTPKPMVDIFGKPFLYWLIKHYVEQGFTDIVVSTGYKAEVIEGYPWPWGLEFSRDKGDQHKYAQLDRLISNYAPCWIVNGDTWIDKALPEELGAMVLVHEGVNAGAQFIPRKLDYVDLRYCYQFFDMGTLKGLQTFKEYFKTHPYYLTQLDKE